MNESSCSSTTLSAFGAVSVLDLGHSIRCVVAPHCWFNLYFPDELCCGASFHICHLYIFFGEVSVMVSGLFVFLLLNFKDSLYILDSSSSVFLSMIVQQLVVILVFSQERVRAFPSTLPS